MALAHGSGIVTDGLVLAYDNGSSQSWKGMPTTNVLNTNGISTQSTTVNVSDLPNLKEISRLVGGQENITHPVHQMANSNWVDLHMMSGTVNVPAGDYFIFSIYIYTGNPTNRFNYNGNFGSTLGTNAGFGGPVNIPTDKWYRAVGYKQNTTGSAITVQYPRLETYSTSVWGGGDIDAWACCPQVEVRSGSSFASPFTPTSRSTTQALTDWAGGNTITLNGMQYNSDGTFQTSGATTTDYISIANSALSSQASSGTWTIDFWLKMNARNSSLDHILQTGSGNDFLWYLSGSTLYFANTATTTLALPTLSTDTWFNLTMTGSSGSIQVYKDGSYVGSMTNTTTFSINSTIGIIMGQEMDTNSGGFAVNQSFQGYYGATKFYDRVLSAAEVAKNYNALRGRFGV
jgi:hypothetical protein